ncbi:hypothetical protein PILCRDRAFT_264133 [Piloderma croceum F 1598]|uniref:Ubiquitin-like domain-containing protein n=1 Tax=Piloderma croceum (strain F 1598) TaxID=765440 RepID=A0A0C3G7Y5_PILCF|nr:hypothetical protein PILCRDRAFT_264133 [Piloderma croceum F 1598]
MQIVSVTQTRCLFGTNNIRKFYGPTITNDLLLHFAMSDPSQSQIGQPRDEKPKIVFQVLFQGRSIKFQQKRATTLRRSLDEAAKQLNMERASLRFTFDGLAIRGEETPETLGMQPGDEIDAHLQQEGGCDCNWL